jgi:purine-binding chemotaxis protein CheW
MDERVAREVTEILRARARALAAHDDAERAQTTEALASFTLGGHQIAVPIANVARAAPLQQMTPIPNGADYLVGVAAVEGHLVSLLDVVRFLDLPRRGMRDFSSVLVVTAAQREIGLVVEQLYGIEDVPRGGFAPIPTATGPLSRLARVATREVMVLDVPLLFDDVRLRGR